MNVTMDTRCQVEVLGSAAAHALAGDGTTAEHGCASSMCHSLSQAASHTGFGQVLRLLSPSIASLLWLMAMMMLMLTPVLVGLQKTGVGGEAARQARAGLLGPAGHAAAEPAQEAGPAGVGSPGCSGSCGC